MKPEMAEIFLRHAREVIEDNVAEVVPLPHRGGADLLLITISAPMSVRSFQDTCPLAAREPAPGMSIRMAISNLK